MAPTLFVGLCLLTLIGPGSCENVTEATEAAGNFTEATAKEEEAVTHAVVAEPEHVTEKEEAEDPGHPHPEVNVPPVTNEPTTTEKREHATTSKLTEPQNVTTGILMTVSNKDLSPGKSDVPDVDLCAEDKWSSQCSEVKEPGQDIPATPENCANAPINMKCYEKLRASCESGSKSTSMLETQVEKFDILISECNKTNTENKEELGAKGMATSVSWSVSAMLMATLLLYAVVDMPIAASGLVM